MDAYGCEAPQFMDFRKIHEPEDKESIEKFFEIAGRGNSESSQSQTTADTEEHEHKEMSYSEEENSGEFCYYTPLQVTEGPIINKRLSQSMMCISDKLCFDDDDHESEVKKISEDIGAIQIDENEKQNSVVTRGRSAKIGPKSNKTARLRRARSSSGSRVDHRVQCLSHASKSPFVSLQERINQFERKTPLRFHSKPRGAACSTEKLSGPMKATIPQSPALATKVRHRPITAISTAEMELKEYEEAKKFKIKAKPVNQKILGPVKPIQPIKKSPTAVVPFNITEVPKKAPESPKVLRTEFHARPAPHPPAPLEPLRKPCTRVRKPAPEPTGAKKKWIGLVTQLQPFSFDRKDQELRRRQEAQREQYFENERKLREFRSKPMPAHIYKQPSLPVKLNKKAESMESLKALRNEDEPKPFKARPPISLMKEPFEPKKSERPLIEITQFQLSVEQRLRERQEFDERRRLKELHMEQERQRREKEAHLQELAEVQRQRKETIHTALPIKRYRDAPIVDPRPVTVPVTPPLVARYKNKENLAQPPDAHNEE